MATIKKTRPKKNDESITEYIKDISHEHNLEPSKEKGEILSFDHETGEVTQYSVGEFEDSVHKSRKMKKINLWVKEELVEDIKALQFISGGINLTEAVNDILESYFSEFRETEEYILYIKLRDKIQKK